MKWMKQRKILIPVLLIAVLVFAFWYGGNAPDLHGWKVNAQEPPDTVQAPPVDTTQTPPAEATQAPDADTVQTPDASEGQQSVEEPSKKESTPSKTKNREAGIASRPGGTEGSMSASEKLDAAAEIADSSSGSAAQGSSSYSEAQGMEIDPSTGKDSYQTEPVPEGKPVPVDPEEAVITDQECTCTLSISCQTILQHIDWLDPDKTDLVPTDGWILQPTTVTFYKGENVFPVLLRTCKQQGIQMEFENTPMYNSAYIEGIDNLYEFDCGELSGWMYQVNGWFPNYGCSRYSLQDGDVVCWVYTCDLGSDVGGYSSAGN